MMRKTQYTRKNNKVKPMTRVPGWMLTVRGWIESYRGENVCDKFIERLYEKMYDQIKDEDMLAEKELVILRQEAQELIVDYKKYKHTLDLTIDINEDDPADVVREQRRLAKKTFEAYEELAKVKKQLVELDELIPHIKMLRDDRIEKIQMLGTEKILAYVLGTNYGDLQDYTNKEQAKHFENLSRKHYGERNTALENEIHAIVQGEEV